MFTKLWYNDIKSKEKANMDNYLMIERQKNQGFTLIAVFLKLKSKKSKAPLDFVFQKKSPHSYLVLILLDASFLTIAISLKKT